MRSAVDVEFDIFRRDNMSNKIILSAFADEADASLTLQIEALQRNKINNLEIRGVDGKNIVDLSDADFKETAKRLNDGGIDVWSMGSPIGKCDIHEEPSYELQRLKRICEGACILGCDNIRMFSFFKAGDEDRCEVIDRLGAFLEIASSYGITLCHENEKGIFGDTAERCKLLCDAFPELRAVFDPANFVQCGVNTLKAWELLSSHVKYLHAKDAVGAKVVPCGMGEGNVPYIFGEYIKSGGGIITLEPHLAKFVGLSALEGGETSMVGGMSFTSNGEAFDYAADTVKKIIKALEGGE